MKVYQQLKHAGYLVRGTAWGELESGAEESYLNRHSFFKCYGIRKALHNKIVYLKVKKRDIFATTSHRKKKLKKNLYKQIVKIHNEDWLINPEFYRGEYFDFIIISPFGNIKSESLINKGWVIIPPLYNSNFTTYMKKIPLKEIKLSEGINTIYYDDFQSIRILGNSKTPPRAERIVYIEE